MWAGSIGLERPGSQRPLGGLQDGEEPSQPGGCRGRERQERKRSLLRG